LKINGFVAVYTIPQRVCSTEMHVPLKYVVQNYFDKWYS